MKSEFAKPEKVTVAAGQPTNMRPMAKPMATKASELIEVQQAKMAMRKKTQDELDQEALLEQLDLQISAHEGQETWEVAQAGVVGQLAAGGQAVGAGAGAAGVGSGAAAGAASSGAYVGIAPTTGVFATPNSGTTGSATSSASSFATTALNVGAGLAVSGLAAAAGGGSADNDKVPPGAPVIARAIDDVSPVTEDVNNAGVSNDTRPQLFITAAAGSTVKVFKIVGSTAVLVSGTVVEGPAGSYTFTPTEALATSQTHTFKASATDPAGNESPLSTTPFSLTIDTTAPAMPTLVVNTIAGNDDVSPTEAADNVNVTGTTSAPNGSVVTVSVNNKTFTGSVDNGAFTVSVPGADLATDLDTQLSVTVAVTDAAGNVTSKEVTKDYSSIEPGAAPTVTLDSLTEDNILNATEVQTTNTPITGTATNAATGDIVTLVLNGETYTGTVDENGAFSIEIPTTALRNSVVKTIEVSLTTDTATVSNELEYAVDTVAPSPYSLTVDDLTSDNILTNSEALLTQFITGTTSAPNGTTVTVQVNGNEYTAAVEDGRYSIEVPGTALLADTDQDIQVTVISTDAAGNEAATDVELTYYTGSGPAPTIRIDPIAGDSVLTDAEILADTNDDGVVDPGEGFISVTGSVRGANPGDSVLITVNDNEYEGILDIGGYFSIAVLGTDLAAGLRVDVSVTTINTLGEEVTGTATQDVELFVLDETPPTVAMDLLYSVGRTATVRFTFSEEVAALPIYNPGDDPSMVGVVPIGYAPFYMGRESAELTALGNGATNLSTENGVFTSFVQDPLDPKVWTAVFLPADGQEVCDITIATGNFADIQNNTNTTTASISIDFTDPQPYAIGINWNNSRLTIDYGADKSYLVENGETVNEIGEYKTDDDDIFAYEFGAGGEPGTDEFSNYAIAYGDRVKNAFYYDGFEAFTTHISVPDTFDDWGGDDVDGNQFEVYYGIYDSATGIFTVTGTPDTFVPDGSLDNPLFGEDLVPTHTLVMYDNDNRFEENFADTYYNKPFYLEGFIVAGLFEEQNWVINGGPGEKYLSWAPAPVGGISFANRDNTTINYGEDPSNPDQFTQFLIGADTDTDGVVDMFEVDILAYHANQRLGQQNDGFENEFSPWNFTLDQLSGLSVTLVHNGVEEAMAFYMDEYYPMLFAAVDQDKYDVGNADYLRKADYLTDGIPYDNSINLPDHIRVSGAGFSYNYYILDDHVPRAEVLEFSYTDDQGGWYPTFVHADGYVYRNIDDIFREATYFETQSMLDVTDRDYYSHWTGDGFLLNIEDVALYRWEITDLSNPLVVWEGEIIGDQIRFDEDAYGTGNVNQNNELYQDYKMTGTLISNSSIDLSYIFNGDDDTIYIYLPQSERNLGRDLYDFTWTLENLVDDTIWTGVVWEEGENVNFDSRAYGGGSINAIDGETSDQFIIKGALISDPSYVIQRSGFGGDFSGTDPYPFIV